MPTPDATVSPITQTCPLCGAPQKNADECTLCDWVRQPEEPAAAERNPRDIIAVLLSVIPGAGHIYKGHMIPGIIAMVLVIPLVVVASATFMFFGLLLIPLYWTVVMVLAYLAEDLKYPEARPGRL